MKKMVILVLLFYLALSAQTQEANNSIQEQKYAVKMDSMILVLDTLKNAPSEELFINYKNSLNRFVNSNEKNYSGEYWDLYRKYSQYYFFMVSQKIKSIRE